MKAARKLVSAGRTCLYWRRTCDQDQDSILAMKVRDRFGVTELETCEEASFEGERIIYQFGMLRDAREEIETARRLPRLNAWQNLDPMYTKQ